MSNTTLTDENTFSQEYTENGVYFSTLIHQGQSYRLGATTPNFRKELTNLPMAPSEEDFLALQDKGLWLAKDSAAPNVAITCGGMGTVWPGLGRALYDTFPAARAAMDEIAGFATWDILSLMDETDMEKLTQSRWQLPYLFFVEYAQAKYLESLGFKPNIMSGHSLGEIISLCFAGVYDTETAWQVFDRRAVYIDGLEKNAESDMGMMAVYGTIETVQRIQAIFPDLHICNQNTPKQYILGGKKDTLSEAKRALRKEKCPAIVLPINMAFHHPHLHVLRQSALDELMGLPINSPKLPIISNVTADIYPSDKVGICEYIADLDENTVRWVDCVHTMWNTYNIRHFVELGSADNVCNLTREIEPQAVCIAVTQKNNEVASMRSAVAALFALGHIPVRNLHAVPASFSAKAAIPAQSPSPAPKVTPSAKMPPPKMPPQVLDILPILAEATDVDAEKLHPHMDLRHDLAMRSNRFPAMLYAFEKNFGITLQFEDVMHVATILDLANVVARLREKNGASPLVDLSDESSSLRTEKFQNILELCFEKAHGLTPITPPLPALVVGACPEGALPILQAMADVHLAENTEKALDFLENSSESINSLIISLPKTATLRPWLYPNLRKQLENIVVAYAKTKNAATKNIYFQADEQFSSFAGLSDDTTQEKNTANSLNLYTLLQSMQTSVNAIFPKWEFCGFDKLEFDDTALSKNVLSAQKGITREGSFFVQGALQGEELYCQTNFSMRELCVYGRRTENYLPCANANFLLHSCGKKTRPLASLLSQDKDFSDKKIHSTKLKEFAKQQSLWHSPCCTNGIQYTDLALCIAYLQEVACENKAHEQYTLKSIEHAHCVADFLEEEKELQFSWQSVLSEAGYTMNGQATDSNGTVLFTVQNMHYIKKEI